ncbi:MAG TPA: CHAT domain-containing tetratricopeptide repeat protein [Candidatus Sulfotelmatobacter sp.]|nr:CHAT domain-containing tetratricopeptide repeat protein [Candidatus Sulfotelmatobacter sp.]
MTTALHKTNAEQLLEELAGLADDARRQKFLAKHRALLRPEIVSDLADKVREQVRVDVPRALRLADAAVAIAQKLKNKESKATALRAKANVLYVKDEHAAAADHHEQAAALFEAAGQPNQVARTLSSSMQPLLLMGEYNRAFAAAERARKIFTAEGDSWRLARLDINLGNIYYRQDRFDDALASYQRAYQGLPAEKDPEGIAAVLSNMATCYISLNLFPKALDSYTRARQFCEEHGMPLLVTQADYNIAYLHYLRGEYSRAIEMLRATRLNAKKIGDAYHHSLCNLDLSELYLELNLSAEAAELSQQGYEGFRKLGMGYESAKCLAFSAMAASQRGHAFEGLKLYSESREIFVKEKNRAWPSLIDLYRALAFFEEGRLFEARRYCAQALESFLALKWANKAVMARLLLARIAVRTGESDQALQHAAAALSTVLELESPVLTYEAHLLLGNLYSAKGDREQAYGSYQNARQSLETLRGNLRGEELKVAFIKNRLEVYENLVELCLARPGDASASEAFTYVEQAKSRSLMDLFARPAPAFTEKTTGQSQLANSIRDLREELNWYYNLIEREQLQPEQQSPDRIAALEKKAQRHEKELVRVLHEATDTDAAQAGLQMPSHVPIAKIRAAIPEDTLLVEYFQVRDRILVCLLGRTTLEIVPVTLETSISRVLRLLQFQLSKFRLGPQYLETVHDSLLQTTQAHLKELYNELLAPVAPKLKAKHLVFVPHGLLHYVPFHALFDGEQHVIDRHTVSYAPSASIYALCQTREANSSGASLVFGIPDPQAPAILDEVQALTGVLDQAELFVGQNASVDVLRNKGPASRLIHIATHGRFRQDNPMFSAIRLGDSFLSLFDLYQLRLPVELITLSGCSTGLNVVAAGDELIGLARGLLHAGAQSLILSLWDVHDKSTADFMSAFYRFLGQGESKADALRAAMLQLRGSYPHCYQWAPFILVGKA